MRLWRPSRLVWWIPSLGKKKFHSVKMYWHSGSIAQGQLIQNAEGKAKTHPQVSEEQVDSALRIWQEITRSSTEERLLSLTPVWRVMATSAGSCWSTSPAQRIHPMSLRQNCFLKMSMTKPCNAFQMPAPHQNVSLTSFQVEVLGTESSHNSAWPWCGIHQNPLAMWASEKSMWFFWEKVFVIDSSGPDRPWSWYFHSEVISRSRKLSVAPNLRRASQPSSRLVPDSAHVNPPKYVNWWCVYIYRDT